MVAAIVAVGADDMCARQGIRPLCGLHVGKIPLDSISVGEGISLEVCHVVANAVGLHLDAMSVASEGDGLLVQLVSVYLKDDGGIDAASVHHDGEVAERLQPFTADDGDGLSGLHLVTNMYEVLGVVGVYGL